MRFENKTAVVTGGSRGIGLAIATKLAKEGANIAILYVGDENEGIKAKEELSQYGTKVEQYFCDVSNFEESKKVVDKVIEEFGSIEILVNNAGITRDKLVLNMDEKDFDAVINVNLKGTFNCIKHVYRTMMKQKYGRIINMSSVVGIEGNAGQVNYAASKAGVIGITKSIAKELGSRGITANAIAPGFIKTDMTDALSDKAKEAMLDHITVKRLGEVSDIAETAAFLASDKASYITGQVIKVDGGMSL